MTAVLKAKWNVRFYNSISGKQSLLQNVCDAIAGTQLWHRITLRMLHKAMGFVKEVSFWFP